MGKDDIYTKMVQITRPGTYVHVSDIPGQSHTTWEILRSSVEWYNSGDLVEMWTLVAVDDEGTDIANIDPITYNPDMSDSWKYI